MTAITQKIVGWDVALVYFMTSANTFAGGEPVPNPDFQIVAAKLDMAGMAFWYSGWEGTLDSVAGLPKTFA